MILLSWEVYISSLWWRDLVKIGVGRETTYGWFYDLVRRKWGDGQRILFWPD